MNLLQYSMTIVIMAVGQFAKVLNYPFNYNNGLLIHDHCGEGMLKAQCDLLTFLLHSALCFVSCSPDLAMTLSSVSVMSPSPGLFVAANLQHRYSSIELSSHMFS